MLKSLKKRFFNFFQKKDVEETQKKEISQKTQPEADSSKEVSEEKPLWVEEYYLGPNLPKKGRFFQKKPLRSYPIDLQWEILRNGEFVSVAGENPAKWSGSRYILVS